MLAPVQAQAQLLQAHGSHRGGQLGLQLHPPHVLQAAQGQAVQQDEGRAQRGRVSPAGGERDGE